MRKHNYFNIVKTDENLLNKVTDIMHIQTSHDDYSLLKKKNWNIMYIEPKDFHEQIDYELKIFFEEFFESVIYILDLPLSNETDKSNAEICRVNSYENFINLWSHYTDENFLKNNYKEDLNFEGLLRSFFLAINLAIFDDKLNWIFYNDVDSFFSALLYSDNIKERVDKIFKDYSGKMTVDVIREDIPNFATKSWF